MAIRVINKETKIKDLDLMELADSITYNINNGYTVDAIQELKNFAMVIKNELVENSITIFDGNSKFQAVSEERVNVTFEYIKNQN